MRWQVWWIAPGSALLSIAVGAVLYGRVVRQDGGTLVMEEIAATIRTGAHAFLRREYRALALFVGAAALCIAVLAPTPLWLPGARAAQNLQLALAYLLGSVGSALAGVVGVNIATRANTRTASAAQRGLSEAFDVGFRGGAVMGLAVVGVGLLGLSLVYAATGDVQTVVGYAFGASSVALFAKVGGGIFTKTADIAADLVGKVELGLAEDDPRNPAVIADNVGDNVGDVAGMGADLLDSYVASIAAVMVLGNVLEARVAGSVPYVQIPLVFAALGIIAAVLGILGVRVRAGAEPGPALLRGTRVACALFAVFTAVATLVLGYGWRVWGATLAGWLAGLVIGTTTDHFTSAHSRAVVDTAEASQTGAALNLITGFAYGLRSVLPSLLGIGTAAAVAYELCEPLGGFPFAVFGISMAAVGMLATVGFTVAGDAYGPIVDNARGIVEQAHLGAESLAVADELDAAGNSAKAITKGFAIGAAGLTVIALLAAFRTSAEEALRAHGNPTPLDLSLLNPLVLFGLMAGLAVPATFSARLMLGVSRNAGRMVDEIRRQFKEIPGLREARPGAKPDYERCIDIATRGALEELGSACGAAIGFTLLIGFLGGVNAMAGYLAGAILSSLLLSLLMANAGGLWDNAKKLIESGRYGGKNSDAHRAAVVGDTVGDPFKDTAGPSLNTLITVMSLISMLLAGSMVRYSLASWLGF